MHYDNFYYFLGKDINDVFDDILFAEERVIDESYSEGFKLGVNQGNPEGYHLGYHRGAEFGAEIGYYIGIIEGFRNIHKNSSSGSDKISTLLEQLEQLLNNFPRTNAEDVDILELADNIRSKFKKFCAVAKINAAYPESDSLSF